MKTLMHTFSYRKIIAHKSIAVLKQTVTGKEK